MRMTRTLVLLLAVAAAAELACAAPVIPSNVQYYLPINVMNQQPVAVAANTPIAISAVSSAVASSNIVGVNALEYKQYYTCNLDNAEFFFANGTIATSWLEGNMLGEYTANSVCTSSSSPNALVDSANVLYWVLDPSQYFLPANTGIPTQNTIYLGWAGNVISAANTLLSNTVTGEAPQLSCPNAWNTITGCGSATSSYGYYDNGNQLFEFYDGFQGNSLALSWNYAGSPTANVDNGLTLGFTGSIAGNYIYGTTSLSPNVVIDTYMRSAALSGLGIGLYGVGSSNYGGGPEESYNAHSWRIFEYYSTLSASGSSNPNTHYLVTLDYTTSDVALYDNYTIQEDVYSESNAAPGPIRMNFFNSGVSADSGFYQWVRAREYPPDGIMPTESFSSVSPANVPSLAASNTILDTGQTETYTAALTNVTSSFAVNFFNVTGGSSGRLMGYREWLTAQAYPANVSDVSCTTYSNTIYCVGDRT